jgi:AcrR family transcriptional regulator
MTDDDICGYEKDDNEPCQLPASREDGRCHHHTEIGGERANGGRPSIFEEYRDDVIDAAEDGLTVEGCARTAGVGVSTLYEWLDEREDFAEAFNRARARGERKLIRQALTDDDVDERTARFLLERSFGYTKSQELALEGDGLTINVPDDAADF